MNTHYYIKFAQIYIYSMAALFMLEGCFPQKATNFSDTPDSKMDSLLRVIKKVEHSDVFVMQKAALELSQLHDSPNANLIGSYYAVKADFYKRKTKEVITKLDSIYKLASTKELEFIRLDIDINLAAHYGYKKDFRQSSKRIKLVSEYILDSKYNLDMDLLIYGLSNEIMYVQDNDYLNELLEIIEKNKSRPWDDYQSRLYYSLAKAYNNLKNKEKAIETYNFALAKNLENHLIDEACLDISRLIFIKQDIELQQKAIDLSIQSGHTRFLDVYYRTLGHCYATRKDFNGALKAYQDALHQDSLCNDNRLIGIDMAYCAWMVFKRDSISSINTVKKMFKVALDAEEKDYFVTAKKIILERMLWTYDALKDTSIVAKLKTEIAQLTDIENNGEEKTEAYQLGNLLQIKTKNSKIKLLSVSKELNNTLILKQKLTIGIIILLLLIICWIGYYYKQKALTIKEIELKNSTIEEKNTELKQLVRRLTESNEMLGNFAQVAAHDIKAPLRTISSFTSILKRKYAPLIQERDLSSFDFITSSCKDLSNIVNDLLDFSSLTQNLPEPEHIELGKLIDVVVIKLQALLNSSDAHVQCVSELPDIVAHKNLITQLFLNIISNSAKYGKQGEKREIIIGHKEYNNKFGLFYIQDNGVGIPVDKLKEVFLIFRKLHPSTQFEGSGIGLATCKKIVNFYEGDIWIESELLVGTTIFFTLPLFVNALSKDNNLQD